MGEWLKIFSQFGWNLYLLIYNSRYTETLAKLETRLADLSRWIGATPSIDANLKLTPYCYTKPPEGKKMYLLIFFLLSICIILIILHIVEHSTNKTLYMWQKKHFYIQIDWALLIVESGHHLPKWPTTWENCHPNGKWLFAQTDYFLGHLAHMTTTHHKMFQKLINFVNGYLKKCF